MPLIFRSRSGFCVTGMKYSWKANTCCRPVPQLQVQEIVVPVPRVMVQEVVRQVPVPQIQTVEKVGVALL